MISYGEALKIILDNSASAIPESLPLLSALGRISSEDLFSNMQVPSFKNSAMDGFAVKCSDIKDASAEKPIQLKIISKIAAGDTGPTPNIAGAVQIMTGAMVPDGFDAVIPVEEIQINNDMVAFKRAAKNNENIRFPGEDVTVGQKILEKGKSISAEDVMLLSSLGISDVKVAKTPNIAVISTGKEITDNYNEPLPNGKIFNSNSPYLLCKSREAGFEAGYKGIIADDVKEFESVISNIKPGTVIITTGAVSKGEWDFIPDTLKKLGAKIHFHRVSIKPGKPVLFATLPNCNYYFGLPGNPISAAIGFRFFVLPLLRKLQGLGIEEPLIARLEASYTKKGNLKHFLKSELTIDDKGNFSVQICGGQESFKISPMTASNAWVVLDEDMQEIKSGNLVKVFPYQPITILTATKNTEVPCKAA